MTVRQVTVTIGGASATTPMIVTDTGGGLVGAHVWPGEDESTRDAIADLEELTGRPLVARRHDYGRVIPAGIGGTDTDLDAGRARKSVLTFRPGKGCTPELLDQFLGSCQRAGVVADIQLWPEMHRYMPPAQYKVICELYVPVIHDHGYTHTFAVTNYGAIMDGALASYWPGGHLADRIGIVFYPTGLSLDIAAGFADDRGVPLGLAEFGADPGDDGIHEAVRFLDYVHDFFAARKAAGKLIGDLIWFSGVRDGDFRVSRAWEFPLAYRRFYDNLMT